MHRSLSTTVARLAATMAALLGPTVAAVGTPASAASTPPVALAGKVNGSTLKDLSKSATAKLDVTLKDFSIGPTYVKVQPGSTITVSLKNTTKKTAHTFTSSDLSVDKRVKAGKSAKVTVTVPKDKTAIRFYCSFHVSQGMQGALYTAAGGAVTTPVPASSSSDSYSY